ncbi:hypothetical protein TNCV_1010971 [Trichonephila clavipes]|uniref:Uncharacterized protein n=1 Tax=Trichonephila clavipes TaxID=2585209 RepID=A0A8X6VX24_TRICX|nr:hypothetical protein TNCV_1010971 [Trichonephila clavipes]
MIQTESAHSALTQVSKTIMSLELFRTIGSTNRKLATPQHDNITVALHLLSDMGLRLASHMPSYCTVGTKIRLYLREPLEAPPTIDTAILSPRIKADFEPASSPQTRGGITGSWTPVTYPM